MKTKEVVDDLTMKRAITRITYEIIERNKDLSQIVLVGIKTRGVYIARRIQERLSQLEQIDVPVAELDTKPFRDDMKATEDTTVLPVDIAHREVILIDDVLYTGRTIRAAIDNLVSHGDRWHKLIRVTRVDPDRINAFNRGRQVVIVFAIAHDYKI